MSKTQTRALILSPVFLFLLIVGALAVKVSLMGQSTEGGKAADSIVPNEPPAFQAGANAEVVEGSVAAVDLLDYFSDPDGDQLVYDIVSVVRPSLPFFGEETFPWIELKPIDEILFLAPKRGDIGTYTVTIEAFDKSNEGVVGDIHIIVNSNVVDVVPDTGIGKPIDPIVKPEIPIPDIVPKPTPKPIEVVSANPDVWWENLRNLKETVSQPTPDLSGIAQQLHSLADGYRDFYLRNPRHAEAGKARFLEALSLIKAWREGDDTRRLRREQTILSIRGDATLPVKLRAEVVATADNTGVEKEAHTSYADRIRAYSRVAKALAREFPNWDTGYESLVGLARVSDRIEAAELLAIAKSSEHATEETKEKAAEAEARFQLIGNDLSAYLRPQDQEVLTTLPANAPVLLYTWSAAAPLSLQKAVLLSERLNPRTVFLGVCLDGSDLEAARIAGETAGLPGMQLYDDESASLASALFFDLPGMGYLVDGGGKIAAVSLSAEAMTELGVADFLK